jgi:hypothetical protein
MSAIHASADPSHPLSMLFMVDSRVTNFPGRLPALAFAGPINPFTSDGGLGVFHPVADLAFHTDHGNWTMNGILCSGGLFATAGSGDYIPQFAFYNFTNISIATSSKNRTMPAVTVINVDLLLFQTQTESSHLRICRWLR